MEISTKGATVSHSDSQAWKEHTGAQTLDVAPGTGSGTKHTLARNGPLFQPLYRTPLHMQASGNDQVAVLRPLLNYSTGRDATIRTV